MTLSRISPVESKSICAITSPNNWPKLVPRNRGNDIKKQNELSKPESLEKSKSQVTNDTLDAEKYTSTQHWKATDPTSRPKRSDAETIEKSEIKSHTISKIDYTGNGSYSEHIWAFKKRNDVEKSGDNHVPKSKESSAEKESSEADKTMYSEGKVSSYGSRPSSRLSTFFNFREEVPTLDIHQAIDDFLEATGMSSDQFWGYANSDNKQEKSNSSNDDNSSNAKGHKKKSLRKNHRIRGQRRKSKSAERNPASSESKPVVSVKKEKSRKSHAKGIEVTHEKPPRKFTFK